MLKVNLIMKDGTELKEVKLFETKEFNKEIKDKKHIRCILNDKHNRNVYICGRYIQGIIMLQQIASYEIINNKEQERQSLINFVSEKNTIYDFPYSDVADFILDNKEELLKIL